MIIIFLFNWLRAVTAIEYNYIFLCFVKIYNARDSRNDAKILSSWPFWIARSLKISTSDEIFKGQFLIICRNANKISLLKSVFYLINLLYMHEKYFYHVYEFPFF